MDDATPTPETDSTSQAAEANASSGGTPCACVPECPKSGKWKIWVQWLAVLPAVGALFCWLFGPLGFWGLCCRIIGSATLWACILVAIDHQEARESARLRGIAPGHTTAALWVNLSIPLLLTVFFLFHAKWMLSALCVLAIVLVVCFRRREETAPWQGYVCAYAAILVATLLFVSSGCPYCGGCKAKSCEPLPELQADEGMELPELETKASAKPCKAPCAARAKETKASAEPAAESAKEPSVPVVAPAEKPVEAAPEAASVSSNGVEPLSRMLKMYSDAKEDVDVSVRVRGGKVEFTVCQP